MFHKTNYFAKFKPETREHLKNCKRLRFDFTEDRYRIEMISGETGVLVDSKGGRLFVNFKKTTKLIYVSGPKRLIQTRSSVTACAVA